MPLTIRPATPDEYPEIADLTIAAYRTIDPELGAYESRLRDVRGRAVVATVLVAVDDDRILGTATYVPGPGSPLAESDDPRDAGMRMLAVSPEAGGRGVGTALVEECLTRASTDGFARFVILTRPDMEVAHRIYERLGFVRAPELDERMPGGVLWALVRDLS